MLINGIETDNLEAFAQSVKQNPQAGQVSFTVETDWKGGCKSSTSVHQWYMAGEKKLKNFTIEADEPEELLGENTAPNPQELLLASINSCMTVGYVATAAMMGVNIRSLTIKATGALDLRGFLGLDDSISPGYEQLDYEVIIEGDGTAEQYQAIHENVIKTSPNRWNAAHPIQLNATLKHN
jgi:uncharacterized OsmC-like protein